MSDDIVAELDRWLNADTKHNKWVLIQRARDEIVALRAAGYEAIDNQCRAYIRDKRNEALEEAALACEAYALQAEDDGKADKADYSANINTARRLMFLIRALKNNE